MKRLIGSIQMYLKNMLSSFSLSAGIGFLGTLSMSAILWNDRTATSWFCLGALMALVAMVLSLLLNFQSYHQKFMLALSMGQTRREFMITYAFWQILRVIAVYISILLVHQLEQMYYRAAFSEKDQAFALSFLTDWRFVVAVIPALALLTMFLGSMYSRFGQKLVVVIYFFWIGFSMLVQSLVNHREIYTDSLQEGSGTFIAWILMMPTAVWIVFGLVVVLVMAITVIRIGMKQMVR